MPGRGEESILTVDSLSVCYQDTRVFSDVSIEVPKRHQLIYIIGPNGAGKSTLLKVLSGIHHDLDDMNVEVQGYRLGDRYLTPKTSPSHYPGILVLQRPEPQLFVGSVEGEVRIGPWFSGLSWDKVTELADQSLERMGLQDFPGRFTFTLSGGEKQKTVIASALSAVAAASQNGGLDVLFLDDPVSHLDQEGEEAFTTAINSFLEDNGVVFLAANELPELPLSGGCVLPIKETGEIGDLDAVNDWKSKATSDQGKEVVRPTNSPPPGTAPSAISAANLTVHSTSFSLGIGLDERPILESLSFRIKEGACVAIAGPNGSGKTTLAKVMIGAIPDYQGSIRLFGDEIRDIRRTLGQKVGFVTQDPVEMLFTDRVIDEVKYGLLNWGHTPSEATRIARNVLGELNLSEYEERHPQELSVGEQRAVCLSVALAHRPDVVIMDEPYSGLDSNRGHDLDEAIRRRQNQTTFILLTPQSERYAHLVSRTLKLAPSPQEQERLEQLDGL